MRASRIAALAGRELRSAFSTPLAWALLAAVQAVLGYVLLLRLDVYLEWRPRLAALPSAPGVTSVVVAPLLRAAAGVMLAVVPLLTMRVFAGERQAGTLTLLLAAPLGAAEVVLGKFLGVYALIAAQLGLSALLPAALLLGGHLDLGHLAAAYLGLALMLAACTAVGVLVSSLCAQPAVAAIGAFSVLLGSWILAPAGGGALARVSLAARLDPTLRGVVDSSDLAFFAVVTVLALALAARRLEASRLRG